MIRENAVNGLVFNLKKQIKNAFIRKDVASLNAISETILDLYGYYDSMRETRFTLREKDTLIKLYSTTLAFEGKIHKEKRRGVGL
jgi:hypothetical protein